MEDQTSVNRRDPLLVLIGITLLVGVLLACVFAYLSLDTPFSNGARAGWSAPASEPQPQIADPLSAQNQLNSEQSDAGLSEAVNPPNSIFNKSAYTPTPDQPHQVPAPRQETELYTVQYGETLAQIAERYNISVEQLIQENSLVNPGYLEVGQILSVPASIPQSTAPDFKIIPDSELVYGPFAATFDTEGFVQSQGGYLANYTEEVDKIPLSGTEIVTHIAQDFSVNPRLLLAVLEHQSGWVTKLQPDPASTEKPIGDLGANTKGLYLQLSWVANNLNRGYYLWRVNGVSNWVLGDGNLVAIAPTINAGTAGVQHMFAPLYDIIGWTQAVTENGFSQTYNTLFGYPFNYAYDPLLAPDLQQPYMQLPFEQGKEWSFTGGPHGGYGSGSAWAALDFAPPGEALGCVPSDEWVVAVADGLVVRSGNGAVVLDLDGDGNEGTGWVVFYLHIATHERVEPGKFLGAGDGIGHPSCEGGFSNGTHVHIARRYNGEWIPADQDIPFNLDGWVSSGDGNVYDGYLVRNDAKIEAYAGRSEINAIQR